MSECMKFEFKISFFDTDAMVEVLELYLVKGDRVCTAVTGLWFMNRVLWLFLFTVTVALTGVQLSCTSEKIICVTRLNLLQDLLEASRGLCGGKKNMYYHHIQATDRFKVEQHTVPILTTYNATLKFNRAKIVMFLWTSRHLQCPTCITGQLSFF